MSQTWPPCCSQSARRFLMKRFLLRLTWVAAVWISGSAAAATLTVTNTNDSGAGSLRQAIANASTGDTINFLVSGTILLSSGELVLTNNLVVNGPGATNLAVSGNNSNRVFEIGPNASVVISGLTVANGRSTNGGGIYNAGSLNLLACILSTNTALGAASLYFADPAGDGRGGSIFNSGFL